MLRANRLARNCAWSLSSGKSSIRVAPWSRNHVLFFDANVLVYSDDRSSPSKQRRTLDLVAEHRRARTGVVSLQVLQEYFVTVTRKLHVDASIARRKVELLAEFDVAAPEVADVLAAIDLHRLHNFSFWDALILRAAKQAGCSVLLSEDMPGAREVDGVRIVNPFQKQG